MEQQQIREALNAHWQASAAGDANAEHNIYADDSKGHPRDPVFRRPLRRAGLANPMGSTNAKSMMDRFVCSFDYDMS